MSVPGSSDTAAVAENLYEADWGSHSINEFTSSGGQICIRQRDMVSAVFPDPRQQRQPVRWRCRRYSEVYAKRGRVVVRYRIAARGVACDSGGNVYAADASGNIYKFTPSGVQSTFATGLDQPAGLAFDSSGNLFEADQGSGTIYKFTPGGVRSTFAIGLSVPMALAFDSSGDLFETISVPTASTSSRPLGSSRFSPPVSIRHGDWPATAATTCTRRITLLTASTSSRLAGSDQRLPAV